MPGGLLNLIALGNQNIILNGNPKKTFFKFVYSKYTNFGLQKFRLDFVGLRTLNMTDKTQLTFKVPRYGDLLMDTYLAVTLPHIWSPIYPPQTTNDVWVPYEFKWIKDLGSRMIKEITVSAGGSVLQRITGDYLTAMIERDFSETKKHLHDNMSGNTAQFNDPGNYVNRTNVYPNAYYNTSPGGAEPSIRGKTIYIPINVWFTMTSKQAFPLIAMQYNELVIDITLRPVTELYIIRDVKDKINNYPYIQPNPNQDYQQFHNFIQTPPNVELTYSDKRTNWNADMHLISTYGFLSKDENRVFAKDSHEYLIKEVYDHVYHNVVGSQKINTDSLGLVNSWMWYFQRSDVNMRNEWSNYTNWPYDYIPQDIFVPIASHPQISNRALSTTTVTGLAGPLSVYSNPDNSVTNLFISGEYFVENQKSIMTTFGVVLDGKYRENVFEAGVFEYVEKYVRTSGNAKEGLYCYNFCINTSPFDIQPSGAMNMSKFSKVELEFTTYTPPLDPNSVTYQICIPPNGLTPAIPIGVNKPSWRIFDYTYDMHLFEERYNIVKFVSGNCSLMYSR
tara:strand:- start:45 stop:1727 length:1683 start_codon:yes stop_codon:yes gene_type:complete